MFILTNNIKRLLEFKKSILLSMLVSIGLIFMYSSYDEMSFNPQVRIVDNDQSSESRKFIEFLKDNDYDVEVVSVDKYYNELVIEKGFGSSIKQDNPLEINYYNGDEQIVSMLQQHLNLFHNVEQGNFEAGDVNIDVVEYKVVQSDITTLASSIYIINYVAYVVYLSSTLILFVFMKRVNQVDVREDVIGISFTKRLFFETCAVILVLLVPVFVTIAADIIINGFVIEKTITIFISQLLAIINVYLIALFINALSNKKNVVIAVATMIHLFMGATSGSWVPYEFLPKVMQYASKVNPLYWLNQTSHALLMQTNIMKPLFIFVLINIVIALLTVVATKTIKFTQTIKDEDNPLI